MLNRNFIIDRKGIVAREVLTWIDNIKEEHMEYAQDVIESSLLDREELENEIADHVAESHSDSEFWLQYFDYDKYIQDLKYDSQLYEFKVKNKLIYLWNHTYDSIIDHLHEEGYLKE